MRIWLEKCFSHLSINNGPQDLTKIPCSGVALWKLAPDKKSRQHALISRWGWQANNTKPSLFGSRLPYGEFPFHHIETTTHTQVCSIVAFKMDRLKRSIRALPISAGLGINLSRRFLSGLFDLFRRSNMDEWQPPRLSFGFFWGNWIIYRFLGFK